MPIAPNSAEARDIAYHIHGQTDLKSHEEKGPKIISKGDGVHVYDDDGKEFIEGLAGLWSVSLGFNEPRLVDAATRQLRELPYYHTFAHKAHLPGIDLAETLINLAPVPMSEVFFANSGSEANDTAMKLVWYYNNVLGRPQKKKIISRWRGYHGSGLVTGSLTGLELFHKKFDLPLSQVIHTDAPYYYRRADLSMSLSLIHI